MLIPKITSYNTKEIPKMYSEWWVIVAIYDDKIFWHRNENVAFQEEQVEKKEMYKKMEELKRDPTKWLAIENKAFDLLTPTQQKSESWKVHRDTKIREIIANMK